MRGLPVSDLWILQRYAELVCAPSWNAYIKSARECTDRLITPKWCDSDDDAVIADHVSLSAYFEAMTAAIAAASGPEKANIIGVLADFQRQEFLMHYPLAALRGLIGEAAAVSLRGATPEEGVAVAETLGWALGGDGARTAIRAFRDSATFTESQRCVLDALLTNRDPTKCPGHVELFHVPTKAEEEEQLRALQAEAFRPDNVTRLRSRVDEFLEATRDGRYEATYQLLSNDRKERERGLKFWIRSEEYFNRSSRLVRWQVQRIVILGNIARVTYDMTKASMKSGKNRTGTIELGTEFSMGSDDYWTLEDGDWWDTWYGYSDYGNRLVAIDKFGLGQATEVPVTDDTTPVVNGGGH